MPKLTLLSSVLAWGLVAVPLAAAPFQILEPTADRWMYPFNGSPGARPSASVFGAVGEPDFDDRDGQMLVRFSTTGIVAAGLGASNYALTSLQLSLTVNVNNAFRYDPTPDSFRSRLDPASPNYLADADVGVPVELFAVGYRNGFNAATFAENSAFSSGGGLRNAFAAGLNANGTRFDVSNNVADGFEVTPMAIGQIAGLTPGALVGEESVMTFNLNLSDAAVLAYLQASLHAGYLEFMVSSLHPTAQMATNGYPAFFTKENLLHDPAFGDNLAAQLRGDVTVVPEPGTLALLLVGAAAGVFFRRVRRG